MTSTGSGSAYCLDDVEAGRVDLVEQPAASSRTRGRSRSTWPRLNAAATGRRSRVCSGGSFSIIWLRCSRLNGSRYVDRLPVASRSGPSRRSRCTALDRRVGEGRATCRDGSCHATGVPARSAAKNG